MTPSPEAEPFDPTYGIVGQGTGQKAFQAHRRRLLAIKRAEALKEPTVGDSQAKAMLKAAGLAAWRY